RCQTPPISLPQVLGFTQSAQGGLPGAGAPAPSVSGAQGALPQGGPAAVPGLSAGLSAFR
ncbi:MAG: hypothetical protein QOE48_1897, partial [Mycobacterium sp.]|nr:hypothetical protein [Mycobacterium sp.]